MRTDDVGQIDHHLDRCGVFSVDFSFGYTVGAVEVERIVRVLDVLPHKRTEVGVVESRVVFALHLDCRVVELPPGTLEDCENIVHLLAHLHRTVGFVFLVVDVPRMGVDQYVPDLVLLRCDHAHRVCENIPVVEEHLSVVHRLR